MRSTIVAKLGILLMLLSWPVVADELTITYDGGWERGYELTFDYKEATVLFTQAKRGSLPGLEIQKPVKQPELAREFALTIAKKLEASEGDGAPPDDAPHYRIKFRREADGKTITKIFIPDSPQKLLVESKAELDDGISVLDRLERRAFLNWLAEFAEAYRWEITSSADRSR